MKTHFDKTLTDHSAENRTWIMGLTFASIVMVIGLVILPFLDEMTGESTKPAPKPIPNQNDRAAIPPLPQPTPTIQDLPNPTPPTGSAAFTVPKASSQSTPESIADLPSPKVETLTPATEKEHILPDTVDSAGLSFLNPGTGAPDSNPIIPAPESNSTSSLIAELDSVPPPPETQSDLEAELLADLEAIAPSTGNQPANEPSFTGISIPEPIVPDTESSPSPVFKVVSEEDMEEMTKSPEEDSELVSNLMKELRAPRPNPEDSKYNNSLIQKFRKKNPGDPASNKELTEAMGDYYKQEGTFAQYAEKFPDWVTQYYEIKKTSTGPVLRRP